MSEVEEYRTDLRGVWEVRWCAVVGERDVRAGECSQEEIRYG